MITQTALIIAKCSQSANWPEYALRFERDKAGGWALVARMVPNVTSRALTVPGANAPTTARTMQPSGEMHLTGNIYYDERYKGCPYCEREGRLSRDIVICGICHRLGCTQSSVRWYTCPWCGTRAPRSGEVAHELTGTSYQTPQPAAKPAAGMTQRTTPAQRKPAATPSEPRKTERLALPAPDTQQQRNTSQALTPYSKQ